LAHFVAKVSVHFKNLYSVKKIISHFMSDLTERCRKKAVSAHGFLAQNLKKYFCPAQAHRKQDPPFLIFKKRLKIDGG
jgi:hypothetical protein